MENPNGSFEPQPEEKKKRASTGLKVTVLVILVVLLAVGILLPIKLVPNAVSSIATTITSLFIPNKNVKITVDKTVINSGETFTISWDGSHKTNGSYSLSYECDTGLRLETSVNQPNETIACGTPYYFSPNTNSIDLIAYSEANRYADVTMTLGFLEDGATNPQTLSTKVVTITNTNVSDNFATNSGTSTDSSSTTEVTQEPVTENTTPTKPSTTNSSEPTHAASNPNGLADLEVHPIAVGYINSNGIFIPSNFVSANQQAAIKFAIINVGNKNSGSFTFSADLPSNTDPRYNAGDQPNLAPGDRIEYVLSFKNLINAQNRVATIYADQSNFIPESSKANNIARMHITNGNAIGSTNGNADLSVRIIDTGVVNRNTNILTPTASVNSGDRVGVRFEVINNGSTATGNWQFSANLPTSDYNAVNYSSDVQPSLNPGERFVFTLSFDNIRNIGNNTATITVDSSNQVYESSESNNTVSANIYRN